MRNIFSWQPLATAPMGSAIALEPRPCSSQTAPGQWKSIVLVLGPDQSWQIQEFSNEQSFLQSSQWVVKALLGLRHSLRFFLPNPTSSLSFHRCQSYIIAWELSLNNCALTPYPSQALPPNKFLAILALFSICFLEDSNWHNVLCFLHIAGFNLSVFLGDALVYVHEGYCSIVLSCNVLIWF